MREVIGPTEGQAGRSPSGEVFFTHSRAGVCPVCEMGDPKERRRRWRPTGPTESGRGYATQPCPRARAAADDEEDTWVAIVQFREAAAKLIFGRHFRCSYRVIGLNCNQEMKLVIRGSDAFRVSGKNTLAFGLRHPVTSTIATTRSGTKCWPHCQGLLIFLLHTCQQRP